MDVSVSIANWNRAELLKECLRSVLSTRPTLQYEVVVVDNASSDDSVAMVRGHFPQVQLIVNAENVGFGRAHNQAMARAQGRYVLLLNNDAAVWPDTIPTLGRFMEGHPEAGACSCPDARQTFLSTSASGAFRQFPSLPRTLLENLWSVFRPPLKWEDAWPLKYIQRWIATALSEVRELEVAWAMGALLLIRKDVLEKIGGFDEQFFLFAEDADLCRRIWAAGWKVFFTTSTSYTHWGGASSGLRSDIEKIRGESGAKYFRKHHGRLAAAMFRAQHEVLRRGLLQWRWRGRHRIGNLAQYNREIRRGQG